MVTAAEDMGYEPDVDDGITGAEWPKAKAEGQLQMTESNSVTVAVTSIEARDGGTCVICVSIKNPPWAPISVEVPVKDLTDPTDALEQARTKVKEFGEALVSQTSKKGSLAFG